MSFTQAIHWCIFKSRLYGLTFSGVGLRNSENMIKANQSNLRINLQVSNASQVQILQIKQPAHTFF